ncbi:MAG TPA: PA14 domain-containing protein [Sedimentisphaerales bacterium]|nr:PA14 domain-containing protein [Sedimentisphaerales bacterium]
MTAATMGACVWGTGFGATPLGQSGADRESHSRGPFAGTAISASSDPTSNGGLLGEYFDSYSCRGVPALTRVDPRIDFNWAKHQPDPPIDSYYFSVRWSGWLIPLYTENYTLSVVGVYSPRVSIADKQIEWVVDGLELRGKVELTAGQECPIEIVYQGAPRGGSIQLFWESPSQAREIIPAGALRPPLKTSHPVPADGKKDVPRDVTLQWTMGARATHHDIYTGLDPNDVASATTASTGIYRGRQTRDAITFAPAPLDCNTVHYWRIDEVNEAHPDSPWKGDVWQFTTADFLVIDDFESYTDEEGERLYEFWIDGLYEENGTGSLVGYSETDQLSVVHSGRESMPFEYSNGKVPYYSEAYRTWDTPQDWTVHGLTYLSLWAIGQPVPLAVRPDGKVALGVPVSRSVWGGHNALRFGYKQATGDCEIVAKVEDFKDSPGVMRAGVMIRKAPDSYLQPEYVALGFTADDRISFERRLEIKGNAVQDEQDARPSARWVKLSRNGDAFSAYHSADGIIWEQFLDAKGEPVVVYLAMEQRVYVGLYMIANTGRGNSTTEFSGIAFTGDVSAEWQVINPDWGNVPDRFYVALEDTAGRIATVAHPDPVILNAIDWTQWRIPLADFATSGVDVAAIRKMYIGVGDRDNPRPSGVGVIHIDDIRVVRP